MDWLNSLLTTAGNTYATVKNADNAPLLAQQNQYGQAYLQGQAVPVGNGQAIPTSLLLMGGLALFLLMKD